MNSKQMKQLLIRLADYYSQPVGMGLIHTAYRDKNITAKMAEKLTLYVKAHTPKGSARQLEGDK